MARCLEELNNSNRTVSFLGHGFSLDFIPLAQSIPLIQSYRDMLKMEKTANVSTEDLLMAKVRMISRFCSFAYPNLDENYILKHADLAELDDFFVCLIQCVLKELSSLHHKDKQQEGTKKKV